MYPATAPTYPLLHLLGLPLLVAQAAFGARVLARLAQSAGGERIYAVEDAPAGAGTVAVIVPVLNQRRRLAPCLDGLIAQGPALQEIVVVDGGSTDGTPDLVAAYQARDSRVRLIDASPVPDDWNGKAWGLQTGLRLIGDAATWVLTIDADVRPQARLVASLLAHATDRNLSVLSVATEQTTSGDGAGLVHPSLLTTLVYRFGIPGHVTRQPDEVQANGQCMLLRRAVLERLGGFAVVKASLCEDVTIARVLAAEGEPIGFYESDGLVATEMYVSGGDAFINWPRSLPMRDRLTRWSALVGLIEVTLVQALPLLVLALMVGRPTARIGRCLRLLNVTLLITRLGVLVGTARAYPGRPWTYWLSPLCDLPVTVQLWRSVARRKHHWRGRILVSGAAA